MRKSVEFESAFVVKRIKCHRSTKDEVKPTARTQYHLLSGRRQVIFHAHNAGFTSSLDMLFGVSSVTEVPMMR
jgi:hypothetical protein